jgi:heterodisulfide reductase subunit A-like polyferredoxin
MTNQSNTVLIIGGGVGGMKAAMELSEAGRDVVLIDKAAAIGGLMTRSTVRFPPIIAICVPFHPICPKMPERNISMLCH